MKAKKLITTFAVVLALAVSGVLSIFGSAVAARANNLPIDQLGIWAPVPMGAPGVAGFNSESAPAHDANERLYGLEVKTAILECYEQMKTADPTLAFERVDLIKPEHRIVQETDKGAFAYNPVLDKAYFVETAIWEAVKGTYFEFWISNDSFYATTNLDTSKGVAWPIGERFAKDGVSYQNFFNGYVKVENGAAVVTHWKNVDATGAEFDVNHNTYAIRAAYFSTNWIYNPIVSNPNMTFHGVFSSWYESLKSFESIDLMKANGTAKGKITDYGDPWLESNGFGVYRLLGTNATVNINDWSSGVMYMNKASNRMILSAGAHGVQVRGEKADWEWVNTHQAIGAMFAHGGRIYQNYTQGYGHVSADEMAEQRVTFVDGLNAKVVDGQIVEYVPVTSFDVVINKLYSLDEVKTGGVNLSQFVKHASAEGTAERVDYTVVAASGGVVLNDGILTAPTATVGDTFTVRAKAADSGMSTIFTIISGNAPIESITQKDTNFIYQNKLVVSAGKSMLDYLNVTPSQYSDDVRFSVVSSSFNAVTIDRSTGILSCDRNFGAAKIKLQVDSAGAEVESLAKEFDVYVTPDLFGNINIDSVLNSKANVSWFVDADEALYRQAVTKSYIDMSLLGYDMGATVNDPYKIWGYYFYETTVGGNQVYFILYKIGLEVKAYPLLSGLWQKASNDNFVSGYENGSSDPSVKADGSITGAPIGYPFVVNGFSYVNTTKGVYQLGAMGDDSYVGNTSTLDTLPGYSTRKAEVKGFMGYNLSASGKILTAGETTEAVGFKLDAAHKTLKVAANTVGYNVATSAGVAFSLGFALDTRVDYALKAPTTGVTIGKDGVLTMESGFVGNFTVVATAQLNAAYSVEIAVTVFDKALEDAVSAFEKAKKDLTDYKATLDTTKYTSVTGMIDAELAKLNTIDMTDKAALTAAKTSLETCLTAAKSAKAVVDAKAVLTEKMKEVDDMIAKLSDKKYAAAKDILTAAKTAANAADQDTTAQIDKIVEDLDVALEAARAARNKANESGCKGSVGATAAPVVALGILALAVVLLRKKRTHDSR